MNFKTKPDFKQIVYKQQVAQHCLTKDTTTRTQAERSTYERALEAVPLQDVELPKLPLVRLKAIAGKVDGGRRFVVLGEIAQMPGKLIVVETLTGIIDVSFTADELELVPPTELD